MTIDGIPGLGTPDAGGFNVPCSDGAGEIVAVGPDVSRFRAGDRVTTLFYQTWTAGRRPPNPIILGGGDLGTLQQYICLSEDGVAASPAHLNDVEAATLTCAGLAAWGALDGVNPGDSVLVQGTGGVALFALQFAKLRGAKAIATSSSDDKLSRAKALGADVLVNYNKTPEWSKEVLSLTGGRGVDRIVEVGGAGTIAQSVEAIAVNGTIAIVGILAGMPSEAPLIQLSFKTASLRGIGVGSRELFEDMCRAIEVAQMKPVIDKVYPLSEVREAFTFMKSTQHFGKVGIVID
ncbi:zinc-dependent alcohol dehydrogenase family protein [Sphingobium ummariense]